MIRTSETIATVAHETKDETIIEGTETKVQLAAVTLRAHLTFG
jgi:hypothetical protein